MCHSLPSPYPLDDGTYRYFWGGRDMAVVVSVGLLRSVRLWEAHFGKLDTHTPVHAVRAIEAITTTSFEDFFDPVTADDFFFFFFLHYFLGWRS